MNTYEKEITELLYVIKGYVIDINTKLKEQQEYNHYLESILIFKGMEDAEKHIVLDYSTINYINELVEQKIKEYNKDKLPFKSGSERTKAPKIWWLAFKELSESSDRKWKKEVSYPLIYDDKYKDMTAKVIADNKIKLDINKKGIKSFKTQTLMGWYESIDEILSSVES